MCQLLKIFSITLSQSTKLFFFEEERTGLLQPASEIFQSNLANFIGNWVSRGTSLHLFAEQIEINIALICPDAANSASDEDIRLRAILQRLSSTKVSSGRNGTRRKSFAAGIRLRDRRPLCRQLTGPCLVILRNMSGIKLILELFHRGEQVNARQFQLPLNQRRESLLQLRETRLTSTTVNSTTERDQQEISEI